MVAVIIILGIALVISVIVCIAVLDEDRNELKRENEMLKREIARDEGMEESNLYLAPVRASDEYTYVARTIVGDWQEKINRLEKRVQELENEIKNGN